MPTRADASRQVGYSLEKIRHDHVKRYQFAAKQVPAGWSVLDLACGCGYGSKLLHDEGLTVKAIDICPEAIEYAKKHYPGPSYEIQDAKDIGNISVDTLVCFETIEHLPDPAAVLAKIEAKRVIASVPNSKLFPFVLEEYKDDIYPHLRHYTPAELETMLKEAGYSVTQWWCQRDKFGEFYRGHDGRFLIAVAERI